ncbi:peptide/nickel transport system ATP-binding protein [Geomicrobium halophilum]|uniref:Peptide/nickel transport system ATP-binding protein n=1 Tax=Geomicrobium halophilum TaxID=549000 RepID=A0A841Q027_9BACL|nr:ABC transporter ATP-binding protein [Geomicrobium halophilum]MBB6450612.1 peptide/nickel transport system ATP-binding protein [Geomicrobium halophilum]
MSEDTVLDVRHLKTSFFSKKTELPVVDDVSFSVKKGETLAIVGESGSGKSMTSLSIMRLVPSPNGKIVGGEVFFNGKDLVQQNDKTMYKVRGNDISMIFQEPMTSLNPVYTIGEQIREQLIYHQKISKREAHQIGIEMLQTVGFSRANDIMKDYPHRLSGGMRQRVMIAMALSNNPKLLIADEPTTALDVTVQAQILDLMRKLSKEYDSAIILITHDLGVVAELAERVVVMYGGQVVEEASIEDIFDDPLHPYTEGLLNSIPKIEGTQERLDSIPGTVPTPDNLPVGCNFVTRCPYAMEICKQEEPTLIDKDSSRKVRCYLHEEGVKNHGQQHRSS